MRYSVLLLTVLTIMPVLAGPPEQPKVTKYERPYISIGEPPPVSEQKFVYGEQSVMAGRPVLVTPEQASNVVVHFKEAYAKLGSPLIMLYVNRDRAHESSTGQTNVANANQTGSPSPAQLSEKTASSLPDKQTVRDIERLFGRPLRMAGANLADQEIASEMVTNVSLKNLRGESDQAQRDRQALSKVADVAIEIIASSHPVTVSELSGENTYVLPDIQATAIRLKDARVLGQATAADLIGRYPAAIVRTMDIREIAEATALTLMEDMLLNMPQQ